MCGVLNMIYQTVFRIIWPEWTNLILFTNLQGTYSPHPIIQIIEQKPRKPWHLAGDRTVPEWRIQDLGPREQTAEVDKHGIVPPRSIRWHAHWSIFVLKKFYEPQVLILACDNSMGYGKSFDTCSYYFSDAEWVFSSTIYLPLELSDFPLSRLVCFHSHLVLQLSGAITLVSWKLWHLCVADCEIRDSRFLWEPALLNPEGQRGGICQCSGGKQYPQFETPFLHFLFFFFFNFQKVLLLILCI